MFAVNFYTSCFDSRETQLGKKLIRLDWEKVVYRPLFTLPNTLLLIISCVMAKKFQGKKHAGTIIQVKRKGKHCFMPVEGLL